MQEFLDREAEALEEGQGKSDKEGFKGLYEALIDRFRKNGYWMDAEQAASGSWKIFGDPDNMSGVKKGLAAAGNWVTDLIWGNIGDPLFGDTGMTFDNTEILKYAEATEVLAGALRYYNGEDPVEFPDSGIQYFSLMADAIEQFNISGRNMDFVNTQLKVLRDLGYDITAEDLPATLRLLAGSMIDKNLDLNFEPIHDMSWEGQTQAIQGMADAMRGLQEQFWQGEISYGDYKTRLVRCGRSTPTKLACTTRPRRPSYSSGWQTAKR